MTDNPKRCTGSGYTLLVADDVAEVSCTGCGRVVPLDRDEHGGSVIAEHDRDHPLPTIGLIIHIAGVDVRVGEQLRQRCSWCGTVLMEYDLTRTAVAVQPGETWSGPATWPIGGLVAVDGNASYTVEHNDGDKLPDEACAQLPHELTGGTL